MTVTLNTEPPARTRNDDDRHTIHLHDGGSFGVYVASPSYAAQMADMDAAGGSPWSVRVDATVYDWDDVTDPDGEAVTFDMSALRVMIEYHPEVTSQLINLVSAAFLGVTVDESKNSNGASETPSEPDAPTTPPMDG